MRLIRFVRAHVDSLIAIVLAAAFVLEFLRFDSSTTGEPLFAELDSFALLATLGFLLSLAARTALPILPLALAYVALAALWPGVIDDFVSLLLGLALAAYSVGAWLGGRNGQIGALGVGVLLGLLVLRSGSDPIEARDIAGPVLVLLAPWLLGFIVRGIRTRRGDPRVTDGGRDRRWGQGATGTAAGDETVRELREIVERTMSTVILEARNAHRSMRDDPRATDRSITEIEAAGTEALQETQRLTGLLLTPDGADLAELGPSLADVEFLAEEVTKAGLPVDTHVTGRPLPLTPDLDAVAYRVVHESLMATLEGARDATANVFIRYQPDALEIEISDDGVPTGDGTDQTEALEAVRKEVAALGGTLDAGPRDGRGYWVLAQLPYEPDWS